MKSKRKYHYIYLVFDNKNGMFYCGKRSTDTPILNDSYFGSGNIIKRISKSCDNPNTRLTKIVLQVCGSYEENIKAEKYWINDVFNAPKNPLFYNFSNGGDGGVLIEGFSDEEKKKVYAKIGLSAKGRKLTDEWKEKISKGGIGLKRSDETKKKISKAKKGNNNSFYGKKHTEDALQKISNRSKGRNNPRATMIEVIDKSNNIIFEGIRKEVAEWCKENGVCSESNLKNHLYTGKIFTPKYNMKAYPNSTDYYGIMFRYK